MKFPLGRRRDDRRANVWLVAAVALMTLSAALPTAGNPTPLVRYLLLSAGLLAVLGATQHLTRSKIPALFIARSSSKPPDATQPRESLPFSIHEALRAQIRLSDELARQLDSFHQNFQDPSRPTNEVMVYLRSQVAELRCENHRLGELDRNRDEFMSLLAHELKAPLAAMSSHVEILTAYSTSLDAAQRDECLSVLAQSIRRIGRSIDDLLQLGLVRSNGLTFTNQPIDASVVVREIEASFGPLAAERGHALKVHLPVHATTIHADPGRVSQVLTNLVSNAIKYTTNPGTISISIEPSRENLVAIAVTDSGDGIPPEERELIFEAFYRSARHVSIEGTGLGLHLSREMAHRMNGRLQVESAPGSGARFVLRLPSASART